MASRSNSQKTQQRGRETRRKLIERTKALLATYDYGSVTLDQVAVDVGVSKSSILWHFGSKEALLTEAVFALFEEVDAKITLEKSSLESLEERVEFLLREVGAYFNQNPAAKGVTITLIFNRSVPDAIRERIREQWDAHVEEI